MGGVRRTGDCSQEQLGAIATYESGKALVSWRLEFSPKILKSSIEQRQNSSVGSSRAIYLEQPLQTVQELKDRICFNLAG